MVEVTQAEVENDPFSDHYNMPLGIEGRLSGGFSDGIEVTMAITATEIVGTFDPNAYFTVYDGEDGLMMRPLTGIDRDVSSALHEHFAWHLNCMVINRW